MASPFPGMDPYLERHWGDVHASLIIYARDQLQKLLPRDLRARVEERVFVESPEELGRHIVPDVRILQRRRRMSSSAAAVKGLSLAEPLVVMTDDEVTQTFIEILDASSGHRVVTVIEVLSPSNKLPGPGQDLYLQKRQELREGHVSLVEIDLLRVGKRPLPVSPQRLPLSFRTTYQVWVRRGWDPVKVEIYRVPLTERLPVIRIPLRQADPDIPLDLQALVDECYQNGDYEEDIDYRLDPDPPLDAADARWADALLRKLGRRVGRRFQPRTRARNRKKP